MIRKSASKDEIQKLAPACDCAACAHGCTMGSGILVDDDIQVLADHLRVSEEELKERFLEQVEQFGKAFYRPKLQRKKGMPFGRCVFLDEERHCKVHPARPTQCRIAMGCKEYGEELSLWFMLNHLVDPGHPESVRQFDAYLKLGGKTLPGGKLSDLVPDAKRRKRILSYEER